MYQNIIIGLLLSGCISSLVTPGESEPTPGMTLTASVATVLSPTVPPSAHGRATEQSVTRSQPVTGKGQTVARKQLEHAFSEAVIIIIIFGVMAGITATILLLVYGIRKLRMRSPVNTQPPFPQSTDDPLSSVETGDPENNNY